MYIFVSLNYYFYFLGKKVKLYREQQFLVNLANLIRDKMLFICVNV